MPQEHMHGSKPKCVNMKGHDVACRACKKVFQYKIKLGFPLYKHIKEVCCGLYLHRAQFTMCMFFSQKLHSAKILIHQ